MPTKVELPNKPPLDAVEEDRRRSQRIHLQIPLFIRAKNDKDEQLLELAKTLDISASGAFIACPCPFNVSGSVTVTIPAPTIASSALVPAGTAPIQCKIVRQHDA